MKKLTEEEKAARKIKRDANKKEKERLEEIERKQICEEQALQRNRESLEYYPDRNPTIFYKVGQRVEYGSHDKTEILEVIDDGKMYKIRNFGFHEVYGKSLPYDGTQYVLWHELNPLRTSEQKMAPPLFKKEEDIRISYYQNSISSILHRYHHSGVDINPDYQRGNVWEMEDKIKLLDSIFNNIDIGKFTFIELPYDRKRNTPHVEILDGKQRLMAIVDFYENRYKYNGYYFKDLHVNDQHHFRGYNTVFGDVMEYPTQDQKYEYFLKLNTGGKPVEESHLNKVRELLNNAKKTNK